MAETPGDATDRPALNNTKMATLSEVREHAEGYPVELWALSNGRTVIRAYNECGNNFTDVDLGDLISWATGKPGGIPALRAAE
jgi:hypothetical protein